MPSKFESDPETVFNLAFSIKINAKKMKKLEKEYTTMKTKEKEDEIELRVSNFHLLFSVHVWVCLLIVFSIDKFILLDEFFNICGVGVNQSSHFKVILECDKSG